MGTVACCQQEVGTEKKCTTVCCREDVGSVQNLSDCHDDSDRITFIQEDAIDKKKSALNIDALQIPLQNNEAPPVDGVPVHRVLGITPCCKKDAVPQEPQEACDRREEAERVLYIQEDPIDTDKTELADDEEQGGFYEIGSEGVLGAEMESNKFVVATRGNIFQTELRDACRIENHDQCHELRERARLKYAALVSEARVPHAVEFRDIADSMRQVMETEPSLIVEFQLGSSIFPIRFTQKPMGMTFTNTGVPVNVEHVIPKSHADKLGVRPGWTFRTVGGTDVSNVDWRTFLVCLKDGTKHLPCR